jgi:hypothetical protein
LEADKLLERAITAYPAYAPAYYLRASLYANSSRIPAAIENLPKAVLPLKFGRVGCQNINRPEIIDRDWKPLADNTEFHKIQEQCKLVHRI